MHRYSIDSILAWTRDGIVWFVASILGLAFLVVVPEQPPDWWYNWFGFYDWFYASDNAYHPYRELGERFLLGCWRLLGNWVDESADWFTSQAFGVLRALIGNVPYWAGTLAHGLERLLDQVGGGTLLFASNAIAAAQWLFDRLPNEIKYIGMSWSQLLDSYVAKAEAWTVSFVGDVRSIAYTLRDWLSQWGSQIQAWYQSARPFLDSLQRDPTGFVRAGLGAAWSVLESLARSPSSFVASALGDTWRRLESFARDSLSFYYNLWSAHASDLSSFLADPGGWIVAKIQVEIERIW